MSQHEDGDYQAVRERLAALGYLRSPLERFVLARIAVRGGFLVRHAAVSVRVALTIGPLLGILFALAVGIAGGQGLTVSDRLLLAVYYAVIFSAAVFILEFAAGAVLALLVRIRRRGIAGIQATAARAGFAVSLLLSAYLVLWWRRRAGAGVTLVSDLAGLAALILINAVLFRVSSVASLAALVRASDASSLARAERRGRDMFLTVAAALLVVAVFFVSPRGPSVPAAPPAYTPIPVAGKLVVVAWDGATVEDAALVGNGGAVPRFPYMALWDRAEAGDALSRPALWTMIATGRSAGAHGVGEIEEKVAIGLSRRAGHDLPLGSAIRWLVPGRTVVVSAEGRRAKAAWEILGDHEGVGVVGWWATWPAVDRGTPERPFAMVTDRAIFAMDSSALRAGSIVPEQFASELHRSRDEDLRQARTLWELTVRGLTASSESSARDGGPPAAQGETAGSEENPSAKSLDEAAGMAAAIDGYAVRVALHLATEPGVRDLFVYLPGLDILRASGSGPGRSEAARRAIEIYPIYVRELIARLETAIGHEGRFALITDPGRAGEGVGSFWLGGTGVRETADPGRFSPLDLTPTLLALRGFPISAEMEGIARLEGLIPAEQERLKPRIIATYGDTPSLGTASDDQGTDEEALERLRSLGYVR